MSRKEFVEKRDGSSDCFLFFAWLLMAEDDEDEDGVYYGEKSDYLDLTLSERQIVVDLLKVTE